MCGIFGGVLKTGEIAPLIHDGLKRLEYRGYDSVGFATIQGGALQVRKDAGRIDDVVFLVGRPDDLRIVADRFERLAPGCKYYGYHLTNAVVHIRQGTSLQHFQRDVPPEGYLLRLVDDTHAATPNFTQNAIVAQLLRWRCENTCVVF